MILAKYIDSDTLSINVMPIALLIFSLKICDTLSDILSHNLIILIHRY